MNTISTPVREKTPGRPQCSTETIDQPKHSMAGCLLSLFLGETLLDHQRSTLDDLFPEQCLTFLVRDGAWVHPADLPLFDFSTLDGLIAQCGPAIMTHQYHPNRDEAELYAVQTAIINPDDHPTIVLGLLGPHEFRHESALSNRFEQLVARLRTDWQAFRPTFARIRDLLQQPSPTLVIDTDSETIVAANVSLSLSLDLPANEVVGADFGSINSRLTGATTATRLEAGPLNLTVVTIEPAQPEVEPVSKEEMQRRTAEQAMTELRTAVAELLDITQSVEDSLVRGIMHTINRHTEVLRGRLEHLTSTPAGVDATHGTENRHTD